MEKLASLKEKSNVLFWIVMILLLVPILLLLVGSFVSPMIRGYLVSSADKLFKSSKAKDESLKAEIAKTEVEIEKIDDQISKVDDKLESMEDDLDWHKKVKK